MVLDEDYDSETIFNSNGTQFYLGTNATPSFNNVPTMIPFIPLGLGIVIVTVLGIIGNLLSAVVLSRKRFRSSYSVLTLGLTIADTAYLLTKLLRYGLDSLFSYYYIFLPYTDVFVPITGPYLRPITFTAHTASTYLTIAIALDRYMAICRPTKGRKFCTTKQAVVTALVVIIFAIIYNIPRWFEFHTEEYQDVDYKLNETTTRYSMRRSDLREDPGYRLYYIFWAYFLVMFVIPFASLSILNFFIWRGVRHIEKTTTSLSSTQSRENSFALMLIGVVVVFLICNLDYLVLDLMDYFGMNYSEFWSYLGNFLLTLNSAVNFLIYCVCGRKFRDEFRKLLGKSCSFWSCNRSFASHDINTSGLVM